jgi:hypothetical protein
VAGVVVAWFIGGRSVAVAMVLRIRQAYRAIAVGRSLRPQAGEALSAP